MASIRRATIEDLLQMQQTNLVCLPENYQFKYYIYHYFSWPSLLHIAEESDGKIVGYVLSKLEDDEENSQGIIQGHITSISVLRTYRRLGLASKLMKKAIEMQQEYFDADYITLNVRVSNRPAFHLYHDVLGFDIINLEKSYYADGEDAYKMKKVYKPNKDDEKTKVIELKDDMNYDEIKDYLEAESDEDSKEDEGKDETKKEETKKEEKEAPKPSEKKNKKKKKKH
ncbi:MAG: GNAT family N-acetyltransferase [archaeon]|nr:GNAT family N-acetyltransferase [archaeon]